MEKLKILFVGLGSIAKRHISNLKNICDSQQRKCQIDIFHSGICKRPESDEGLSITDVYFDEKEVPDDYDIIFITNPTIYHLDALKKFCCKGRHFFVEKPLCTIEQIKEIPEDFKKKESIYYVACPLRFHPVIQYLKKNVCFQDVFCVRAISSSYLPEWRENVDYRQTYSAHQSLGGGVSIDLIHEWDYLCYLLGRPQKVYPVLGKVSDLEIDSDDIALYIAQYNKMMVEIHLDYFGRKTIRQLQLFMKEDTIMCDLIKSSIVYSQNDEEINFRKERNEWQKEELKMFLNILDGKTKNPNGIEYACGTLNLTRGIA